MRQRSCTKLLRGGRGTQQSNKSGLNKQQHRRLNQTSYNQKQVFSQVLALETYCQAQHNLMGLLVVMMHFYRGRICNSQMATQCQGPVFRGKISALELILSQNLKPECKMSKESWVCDVRKIAFGTAQNTWSNGNTVLWPHESSLKYSILEPISSPHLQSELEVSLVSWGSIVGEVYLKLELNPL